MMPTGKVALFSGPGKPVQIIEEEVRDPASDEILVQVSMAGICGSDVHRMKGDVPFNSGPVCFGHEAVGVIQRLGIDVKTDTAGTPLAEGDMLYWMPLAPCGSCLECNNSRSLRCKDLNWPPPPGKPNGAGFRQFGTLKKKCIYIRVPPSRAPENIIAFGCAMPTALRGFKQPEALGPKDDVVIQGSGPVGLACTVLASLAGARSVIVIGDPTHRLEVASTLGATHTMSVAETTAEQRLEKVKLATSGSGASVVVEAAGVADAFPQGLDLLGMNGRYLIMGLYSGNFSCCINPVRICSHNLRIIGSLGIDVNSFQATVDIASRHGGRLRFADLITHRLSLDHLQEGLDLAGQGVATKAVIVPN